jgi:hypothetical protein
MFIAAGGVASLAENTPDRLMGASKHRPPSPPSCQTTLADVALKPGMEIVRELPIRRGTALLTRHPNLERLPISTAFE